MKVTLVVVTSLMTAVFICGCSTLETSESSSAPAETKSITWAHLIASGSGTWYPAPGYTWNHLDANGHPPVNDFSVHWQPGNPYWYRGEQTWPNIVAAETEGGWWPKPGYVWANVDSNGKLVDYSVRWQPGCFYKMSGYVTHPHIYASENEGSWSVEPGYTWVHSDRNGPMSDDVTVRWNPGVTFWYLGSVKWPHIVAGEQEGSWSADPGYKWSHLDDNGHPVDLAVQWEPGLPYVQLGKLKWPNVVSSGEEEEGWYPAPGYVWAHTDQNGRAIPGTMEVRWAPGAVFQHLGSVKWPHVIATTTEGEWIPESGYEWAHLNSERQPVDFVVQQATSEYKDRRFGIFQNGYWTVVPEDAENRATRNQSDALNDRWAEYLKQIQDRNDYANWSGPPYDLYVASHPR